MHQVHIQIPLIGYVGLIWQSAAVTTASWSSCKDTQRVQHYAVTPVRVAAAYPYSYPDLQ